MYCILFVTIDHFGRSVLTTTFTGFMVPMYKSPVLFKDHQTMYVALVHLHLEMPALYGIPT